MQRNYLRGLLICLIPCLVAAYYAARLDKYRLGIDLAGGTVLVYEINLERTKQLREARKSLGGGDTQSSSPAGGLSNEDMVKLAAQIKRRIDPADLKNVTVRPLGDSRVEIILPTGGATAGGRTNLTAEEIDEVKQLVKQMGVLEFRILANKFDDERGVQAASALIDNPTPEYKKHLDEVAELGLAPRGPDETFPLWVNEDSSDKRGDAPKVKYVWVELGPEERETLGLSNKYADKPPPPENGVQRQWMYPELAPTREKTYEKVYNAGDDSSRQTSMLLYSRECKLKDPKKREAKKYDVFVLTRVSDADTVRVEGDISLTAQPDTDPKNFKPSVTFTFNSAGGRAFGKMTSRNKPDKNAGGKIRSLAILLDDKIVSAPSLNAVITTQGSISGNFDRKSVERLVNFLRNGALNAQLREEPVSTNKIDSTLGADTIQKGTRAVALSFAAVLVFMLIYYRFAGMVACVALLANLLLTIGFMVLVNAAFTLPGLAGIVLMLGMAVDANVLIYERLREERNKGANLATAIRNGYDRAFLTIIDTHLTSIFTAVVLYTMGNDNLKGFSISLAVGLIISLFTSLYMTRLMFDFWQHKKWLVNLRMMRLFERPTFNPMKYRFYFFTLTTVLTVLGLGLFLFRGEELLDVDFRGGTVYSNKLKEGEERAMIEVDGKPGYRDLLSEDSQKKRLNAESARWVNKPSTGDAAKDEAAAAALGTYVYEITYAGGDKATVTLTQKPDGITDDDKAKDVVTRARQLPSVKIEPMFLDTEDRPANGRSRYFTIRTTERQPDLVRVSIDRLMRNEKGESIIAAGKMSFPAVHTGPVVELSFDVPTSVTQVRDLLSQHFKDADDGPTTFDLKGIGAETSGRYEKMQLNVSANKKLAALSGTDPKAKEVDLLTLQRVLQETKTAFDTRPEPIMLQVFDSQLATETRAKAFYAILASWLAIMLYLWFRFGNWTFGTAAVMCLVHDLCFTLGAIAACHYLHLIPGFSHLGIEDFKIDLATVAALLTLVGYSVNEIIVNFARIREVRGKNPTLTPQMINDSVNQTLSRTILTSMTVLLVSIVLYAFGGEGVHLFAFVMMMGVLVSTYSSIFIASPLLLFLGEGRHESGAHEEEAEKGEGEGEQEEQVVEG